MMPLTLSYCCMQCTVLWVQLCLAELCVVFMKMESSIRVCVCEYFLLQKESHEDRGYIIYVIDV